jgi:competence protein ComEC
VIHIIAISGLHLGIIYAIMLLIMKPLLARKKLRVLVNVFVMGVLWVFTLICGASPSVTRSAVMFSSILAGDSMGAENNTGKAVASSAFILLCFDPLLLWDLGFQLSYAAVASLLIFNRSIVQIFSPDNGLLILSWNSIATSISAQILTTPLVLVHFHQFPLLFILLNFVAVPVSGIILILLIVIVACQSFPLVPGVLSALTGWCIRFMNNQVERIAFVRFSVWENIHWNWIDVVLAYFAILVFTLFVQTKITRWLILFLLTKLTWLTVSKYSSL